MYGMRYDVQRHWSSLWSVLVSLVLYAFACFCKVFLAIFQAKNVQYSHYVSAFLTSLVLTGADILFIRLTVANHIFVAVFVGSLANAVAVVSAIKLYNRIRGIKP